MASMGDIRLCIRVLLMFKIVSVLFHKRVSIHYSIFLFDSTDRHSRFFELFLSSHNLRFSLKPTAILLYKIHGFTMCSPFNTPPTCSYGSISSHLDTCLEPFHDLYGLFVQSVNIMLYGWLFLFQFVYPLSVPSVCGNLFSLPDSLWWHVRFLW